MPKIRLAWGPIANAKSKKDRVGAGKWIPDTPQNRLVLDESLDAFNFERRQDEIHYWMEYKKARGQKDIPHEIKKSELTLPWWTQSGTKKREP